MCLILGIWAQFECGTLSPEEFSDKFGEYLQSVTSKSVSMKDLIGGIQTAMVEPHLEVITAIQCIRAEGLKTALITNNWLMDNGKSFCPVDGRHFDVVRSSLVQGDSLIFKKGQWYSD